MVEVVRTDLQQLLARTILQPAREAAVQAGALLLRQPCVGDLADEHVLEAEGPLPADRRARLAQRELPQLEILERRLDVVRVGRDVGERAEPEDPADHGGALQQRLLERGQDVDAGGDQPGSRLVGGGGHRRPSLAGAAEAGRFLRVPGTNPFFPLPHDLQGNRFLELLEEHPLEVYVLNTGRVGGPETDERSKKVKIRHSSAIVKGIAEGTIYRHFASKQHLVNELYRAAQRWAANLVQETARDPDAGTIRARLTAIALGLVDGAAHETAIVKLGLLEPPTSVLDDESRKSAREFRLGLERLIAEGFNNLSIADQLGVQPLAFESSPYYLYHPHAIERIARGDPIRSESALRARE